MFDTFSCVALKMVSKQSPICLNKFGIMYDSWLFPYTDLSSEQHSALNLSIRSKSTSKSCTCNVARARKRNQPNLYTRIELCLVPTKKIFWHVSTRSTSKIHSNQVITLLFFHWSTYIHTALRTMGFCFELFSQFLGNKSQCWAFFNPARLNVFHPISLIYYIRSCKVQHAVSRCTHVLGHRYYPYLQNKAKPKWGFVVIISHFQLFSLSRKELSSPYSPCSYFL